jgi:type II secretory pathway pseudopilin PulG
MLLQSGLSCARTLTGFLLLILGSACGDSDAAAREVQRKLETDRELAAIEATTIANCIKIYLIERRTDALSPDFTLEGLLPGYIKSRDELVDPWGTPYQLDAPGKNGRAFDVVSLGADRQRGGDGSGVDIIHRDKSH